jgi:tetratricopeptide (TPR) repeat protein
MRHSIIASAIALLLVPAAFAQEITLPPSGGNQRSHVSQSIGLVTVSVDYSSPHVVRDGKDRRGHIWGELVPYGLTNLGFGTCTECPWRAGANENTVFTTSHDIKVEGQPLPAGSYGLSMIAAANDDWTVIFSKNSTSWGSFYYDPKDDALRVKVKPSKSEYNEYLTYEFTDREQERATVAMRWEELQVPLHLSVDNMADLYMASIRNELRNSKGFSPQAWVEGAQYALLNGHNADALEFAQTAVNGTFIGQENFNTLSTLAMAQEANGKTAEARATREKAFAHPTATATDLHQYARQQLAKGDKTEALRVWELNAKLHPNQWPVNVGLARGYSAVGRYKDALKYAKLALAQAPDGINKHMLEDAVKALEAGKDMNS